MRAEELLHQGDLSGALAELQQAVRSDPANAKLRVFLFQLLCVVGDWERALTQLEVAGELDTLNLAMVQTYREAIRCELFRQRVFNGETSPLIFGDPPEWTAYLLEALRLTASGEHAQANELRARAFELAPATPGSIDDTPFTWIADADARLGTMLEIIVNGRYYWVPFQRLTTIDIEPPEDLRDLIWVPAHLTLENQGETVALIPSRYPGSERSEDTQLQLAKKTLWDAPAEGVFLGAGQRLLTTDIDEYPLLNTRKIILQPAASDEQTY